MAELLMENVYLLPANDNQGFGFSQFVLHPAGNILLPRTKNTSLSDQFAWIRSMGGIKYVLVSDRHFAGPGCMEVANAFGAAAVISEVEARAVARRVAFPDPLEFKATDLSPDIKLLPTPGHTAGQFSFLICTKKRNLLFTGDFIRWRNGDFIPGNKSRSKMHSGLQSLSGYQIDVLVGCTDYDAVAGSYLEVSDMGKTVANLISGCPDP